MENKFNQCSYEYKNLAEQQPVIYYFIASFGVGLPAGPSISPCASAPVGRLRTSLQNSISLAVVFYIYFIK